MKPFSNALRWCLFLPLGAIVGFAVTEVCAHLGSNLIGHWWWGNALVALFMGYWRLVGPYRIAKWVAPPAQDISRNVMKAYCCLLGWIHVVECCGSFQAGGAAGIDGATASASPWGATLCLTIGSLYGLATTLEEDGPSKLCEDDAHVASDFVSSFDWRDPTNTSVA